MKLYVPNPQLWVTYLNRVISGETRQTGQGRRACVIPVTPVKPKADKEVSIKAVLPSEQTVSQAKSELERKGINLENVEESFQNGSGRGRRGTKRKSGNKQRGGNKRSRNIKQGGRDIFETNDVDV